MKKYLVALGVLLSALNANAAWLNATVTSPSASQVLVDTGQLPTGGHPFCWVVSANVAGDVIVQYRNAANNATNSETRVFLLAGGSETFCTPNNFEPILEENERIRIINGTNLLIGTVHASLMYY